MFSSVPKVGRELQSYFTPVDMDFNNRLIPADGVERVGATIKLEGNTLYVLYFLTEQDVDLSVTSRNEIESADLRRTAFAHIFSAFPAWQFLNIAGGATPGFPGVWGRVRFGATNNEADASHLTLRLHARSRFQGFQPLGGHIITGGRKGKQEITPA